MVEFIGKQADAFPAVESLRTIAGQITREAERKGELHEKLKNLGIEPRGLGKASRDRRRW